MVLLVIFGVPIAVIGLIVISDILDSRKYKNQDGGW